jgi:small GTP-binding protein
VIVIGNSGVGKSCLSVKATKNIFTESYSATIGFEFFTFNIKLNNNKVIKLQIWDTCGQEIYRSLITNFYRNCSLAIIVYSVTEYIYYILYNAFYYSRESFESIETWIKELRTKANPDAKVIFIGNKIDLENDRKITQEEGKKLAEDYEVNLFMETSAKTGFNAQELFVKAAELLNKEFEQYQLVSDYNIFIIYIYINRVIQKRLQMNQLNV